MKNFKVFGMILLLLAGILAGCTAQAAEEEGTVTLRLAHNQGTTHPIHTSLTEFARLVEEKTEGSMKVKIYPSGQLGGEREALELTQTGAIDFAKVSAGSLENFSEVYSLFSLPYLFDDKDHFYKAMNSSTAKEVYQTTTDIGLRGLTFYESGTRNFYTKNKPILHPDDLKGLKIRVQPSPTNLKMLELMGGSPTPMSFGEVYTAMQQGVIDGSENNETALTDNNHGEVAKQYSYSEHAIIPDILIINESKWNQFTAEQKKAITEAAEESSFYHKEVWRKATEKAIKDAKDMNVTFSRPDKEPFMEAVQPLHKEFAEKKSTGKYYKEIRDMAEGN